MAAHGQFYEILPYIGKRWDTQRQGGGWWRSSSVTEVASSDVAVLAGPQETANPILEETA